MLQRIILLAVTLPFMSAAVPAPFECTGCDAMGNGGSAEATSSSGKTYEISASVSAGTCVEVDGDCFTMPCEASITRSTSGGNNGTAKICQRDVTPGGGFQPWLCTDVFSPSTGMTTTTNANLSCGTKMKYRISGEGVSAAVTVECTACN